MNKQWSLFVQWSEHTTAANRHGYVHFLWAGTIGKQIDYSSDHKMQNEYTVHFPGTDTFDGFVKWAFDCAKDLPAYEYVLMPGCPECGSILNAKAAGCTGLYHADNQSSVQQLSVWMRDNLAPAVKAADNDEVLAALNVLRTTANVVSVMWPIWVKQVQAAMNTLRVAGVEFPKE